MRTPRSNAIANPNEHEVVEPVFFGSQRRTSGKTVPPETNSFVADPIPRSCKRPSTFRSDMGNRTYNITARRMMSGLVLIYRNGERFFHPPRLIGALPASSAFTLTVSFGRLAQISTLRAKYLNSTIKQDHRLITKRIRPMLGFETFNSAAATMDGIEVTQLIRKKRPGSTTSGFAELTAFARSVCPNNRSVIDH